MDDADRRDKFYKLAWPHMVTVARMARFLAANDADGDDLAQEVMLKAYRAIDTFRGADKAKAWLMTILRNAHVDSVRAAPPWAASLDQAAAESVADLDTTADGAEGYDRSAGPEQVLERLSDRQLIQALRSLPKEIRWTLLLVDVQGLDHADAASILGVPVGTVKSRAHRGRAMLRASLVEADQPRTRRAGAEYYPAEHLALFPPAAAAAAT